MALMMAANFRGIALPAAYYRVSRIEGDKAQMTAVLGMFASADTDMLTSTSYSFNYTLDGANPFKQAYEYIKTLPDFAGAADVLEAGQTP